MFMETLVYGIQRPQPAQTNVLVNTTALSARVNYFTHPQWHVDGCGDYDFSNLEGNGK
jgi:hypothetical protein